MRNVAMSAVRWLRGPVDQRPTYRRTRSILLRGLGVVYLAAFGSLAVQVDGLIGSRGITPAAEFLDQARLALGGPAYREVPTLLWLDSSDGTLHALCWGGVGASLLLIAGILPGACLVFLWASYLSMTSVGSPFLNYQWDMLLLESGLLAILLAPWNLRLSRARGEPRAGAIWLFRWLVFRLMLLSGAVKLTSGDPSWSAWQAMKYHYETQPLPTWTSWYMHQLPPRLQEWSVGYLFWAELVAPFLIFGPRRVRMVGLASIVLLQALIAATGNYGFFNLLSVVLCLSLVDDRDLGRKPDDRPAPRPRGPVRAALFAAAFAVIVTVTAMEAADRAGLSASIPFPGPLESLRSWVTPFRSMNSYGLFAVMTTERPEILLEGSEDGDTWTPYTFRWKSGDVERAPRFCTPHMPRLDWQMWFAALGGDCRTQPWFLAFERRLLEGSPEVLRLLHNDPFADKPPRLLRARLYQYRFTKWGDRDWWRREEAGSFCPTVSLRVSDPRASGTPSQ
jgi:hypothetical protein